MTVSAVQPKAHFEIGEGVFIRTAQPTDVPSLCTLGIRVFTITFGHSCSPSDLADYLNSAYTVEAVNKDLEDPTKIILVAIAPDSTAPQGEKVIGYAYLHTGPPEACVTGPAPIELMRIYVDEAWHGRRVASGLMRECMALSVKLGYETIWLGVWEENVRGIKFYEKEGYKHVGDHDFWLGKELQTDLVFARSLV